jgi:hypothetical protein
MDTKINQSPSDREGDFFAQKARMGPEGGLTRGKSCHNSPQSPFTNAGKFGTMEINL